MHEKSKLIQSMGNLINHITKSRNHQEEIFYTFSKEDLRKIIGNLQDSHENIRHVTLALLTHLLLNNPKLQASFCQSINVKYSAGKIVLTSKFPQQAALDPLSIMDIYRLMKSEVPTEKMNSLFWYINPFERPPKIEYIKDSSVKIDPAKSIVGLIILQNQIEANMVRSYQQPHKQIISVKNQNEHMIRSVGKSYLKRKNDNKYTVPHKLNKTQQFDFPISASRNNNQRHKLENNYTMLDPKNINFNSIPSNNPNRRLNYSYQRDQEPTRQTYVNPPAFLSSKINVKPINIQQYSSMKPIQTKPNSMQQSISISAPLKYIKTDNFSFGSNSRNSLPNTSANTYDERDRSRQHAMIRGLGRRYQG